MVTRTPPPRLVPFLLGAIGRLAIAIAGIGVGIGVWVLPPRQVLPLLVTLLLHVWPLIPILALALWIYAYAAYVARKPRMRRRAPLRA